MSDRKDHIEMVLAPARRLITDKDAAQAWYRLCRELEHMTHPESRMPRFKGLLNAINIAATVEAGGNLASVFAIRLRWTTNGLCQVDGWRIQRSVSGKSLTPLVLRTNRHIGGERIFSAAGNRRTRWTNFRMSLPKPYYSEGGITIYCGDAYELIPEITADVLCSDPQYGIGFKTNAKRSRAHVGLNFAKGTKNIKRDPAWKSLQNHDKTQFNDGTLIFKWNEHEIPVSKILALTPEKPLIGQRCGKTAKTHWIVFIKS